MCFGTCRFRLVVIPPPGERRQRHEDGFGPSTSRQAKARASIVQEIEFHVASPSQELELTLPFAVRLVAASLDDRKIREQNVLGAIRDETEDRL